ncbi:MAG: 16S rRNA (uracil(1498)-N(3))-methyltransferase [Rickettsiales bacterium]|nr:16S rRNA (uracil(1498)-N(3))-methyltransferase [Rickettsiales bacterium]
MSKIRLFIAEKKLEIAAKIKISGADFDYLTKVMRQKIADKIFIFNGADGDFAAVIEQIEKNFLIIKITAKISDLKKVPNFTLAFAPVKNVRIDFIAAKATELGVAAFLPIITQHTIVNKINFERFQANIKEACEQCGRNDFAQIYPIKKLDKFLDEKESAQKIFILCDESGQGEKASKVLSKINAQEKEIVILVGPEGGFSASEFAKMRQMQNLYAITLGPRILRADTAIISALTLVQEFLG